LGEREAETRETRGGQTTNSVAGGLEKDLEGEREGGVGEGAEEAGTSFLADKPSVRKRLPRS